MNLNKNPDIQNIISIHNNRGIVNYNNEQYGNAIAAEEKRK